MKSCINFPELLIYGHEPKSFDNLMFSVNLTTFEIKAIKAVKEHSPKGRKGAWTCFSDSRLYVSGGMNKEGKQVDSLMWTYNIESGYWFALELAADNGIELAHNAINC